jgi:hypothetical protein
MISALRPAWGDRLGAIRGACLDALKDLDADIRHEEAEVLFELFVTSDERAPHLLEAIDSASEQGATEQITHLRDLVAVARTLQGPASSGPGQARDVA